jgi:HAD superfamily hydrolase (TIGR01662 family)
VPKCIEAVLFDLGDTLIYFDGDWPKIFAQARGELYKSLQNAGLRLEDKFLDEFSQRMLDYYRERDAEFVEYTTYFVLTSLLKEWGFDEIPEEILLEALADMHAVTQAHWIAEEDAVPTLERLRIKGYRMALVSNAADDPNTQVLVDKLGARSYFSVILSSAAAGIRKPNPQIFLSVLKSLNVPPERSVMVGDTLGADILGAKNAGIYSIWITRRADTPANRAHASTIFPNAQIDMLSQLPDLLENLKNC